MTSPLQPGLLILHGNRTELLAEVVFDWIAQHPLGPLEEAVFLVQSNGMAEWLKMALARHHGICAATRVDLPARFLWRTYRQLLGRQAVPARSALDKTPLTWRLMRQLPGLLARPGFEPLARFLHPDDDVERRLQLCRRLADLYDQYQVYRSDWLDAWAAGRDALPQSAHSACALSADQRWQAALWRELLAPLSGRERASTRSQLHGRFLEALAAGDAPVSPLPRRVVLFGASHLPMQMLQALAALSARSQVLLAIPNPCRYHWADIIQGRELLQAERRRQPLRQDRNLADVALQDMHVHAHPLLAAWGRQGRDFVRQLDAFDDVLAAQERFAVSKVDLFDEGDGPTLLGQVQARIRDLVPLAEHAASEVGLDDRSIVFHIAHGAQREVEILHDQLLMLLAQPPPGERLHPRDMVVMVPAIDTFAPAIDAVFGQYAHGDKRHIPYAIADLTERRSNPLLIALEWLLRLPQQRCTFSEVCSLLDVPAVAGRFGLQAADLPRLAEWMEAAGIRWGLDGRQRAALGLDACGEQNTWLFGLRRMLLGYASGAGVTPHGAGAVFGGIEPCTDVGGLEAAIAGSLACVLERLVAWWQDASIPATPNQWAERCRQLVEDFMAPQGEHERLTVLALHESLGRWLEACEAAGFDDAVPLAVVREAWLSGIDEPELGGRFRAGGVTFCTLMPMRSIPFEVVCLLGMNDGDYPRASHRNDFDLMGQPGQARPGDRSRRDDDRQLMLEALLSARRVLYVSWSGRSARDNSEQPPSVLVSQLRDYLAAGWTAGVVDARTTEHPLQPFSRRYFERPGASGPVPSSGRGLFTHAREWRAAHAPRQAMPTPAAPRFEPDPEVPVTVGDLTGFLRNPVKTFFRRRLGVVFPEVGRVREDDEAFVLDGLDEYGLLDDILRSLGGRVQEGGLPQPDELHALVAERVRRIHRTGRLPSATFGRRTETGLIEALVPMLERWHDAQDRHPGTPAKEPLRFAHGDLVLGDWLDGLRAHEGERTWLELVASRLCTKPGKTHKATLRSDKLLAAWVRTLACSACGTPARGVIVGRDATVTLAPLPQEQAAVTLQALLETWRSGMDEPLPLACRTALAWLGDAAKAAATYEDEGGHIGNAEGDEPCLARVYPDYESLTACGRFETLADRVFRPVHDWTRDHVRAVSHADAVRASNADALAPLREAT